MHATDENCPFCSLPRERIVAENDLAFAFRDGFPVTELHTLVVPRQHSATYFDLTDEEREAIHVLLAEQRDRICGKDGAVVGFNIGWNCGEAAGQTIFHTHVHLIPRRDGDVENPRGGVRHTVPGKGYY